MDGLLEFVPDDAGLALQGGDGDARGLADCPLGQGEVVHPGGFDGVPRLQGGGGAGHEDAGGVGGGAAEGDVAGVVTRRGV